MNHFDYLGDEIACEAVPLSRIAQEVGTPAYVYSSATLKRHFAGFAGAVQSHECLKSPSGALPLVAFAVKSNSNLAVLKTLGDLGAGADTVSEGEIRRALAAGIPASRIVFSGVGKLDSELEFALCHDLYQINVESEPELLRLSQIAARLNKTAHIVIRINPGVGAGGHAKITTGTKGDKFGVSAEVALDLYAKAASLPGISPEGFACHIGSQISDLKPLHDAFTVMRDQVLAARARGLKVTRLDLGGGLGVPYFNQPDPPLPDAFAAMVAKVVGGLGVQMIFEPGRNIAANAGVLLSRVVHVHERPSGQAYLVVDAAMNDLMRPALYDAYHQIDPVNRPVKAALKTYDVVGPICETGDTFSRGRDLPPLNEGDLVIFRSAGAYGASMGSEYNSRPLAPEVLVSDAQYQVVRKRPSYQEMLDRETLAPWQKD